MRNEMNRARHWSDDELLLHLYGVGPEEGHAAQCPECVERLERMRLHRQGAPEEQVSPYFLTRQRQAILEKTRTAVHAGWRWRVASGMAVVTVLVGGSMYFQFRPEARPAGPEKLVIYDKQLFADVSSLAEKDEPAVSGPMHELFED